MSFCPGLPVTVIMGAWNNGCTTQIMDVLDARFYKYGIVALVVYHSPGFTPPLSRVLISGMAGSPFNILNSNHILICSVLLTGIHLPCINKSK